MLAALLLLLCAGNCVWLSAASSYNSCQSPPGLPGRDGRDGRDGAPGPAGPPGSPGRCDVSEHIPTLLFRNKQTRDGPVLTETPSVVVYCQCDRDPGGDSGDGGGCDCPVLHKRLLTPRTLQAFGSLSDVTSITDGEIHFTSSQLYSRLLRFVIGPPGQVPPSSSINLMLSVQLHFLRSPTADSDPIVAICDNAICNAVAILDAGNYPTVPCLFRTFTSGPSAANITHSTDCGGEIVDGTDFTHPRMVSLLFSLNQRWASFTIPDGNGFTASGVFDRQLEFTRGLNIEIYGDHAGEEYRLSHILLEVFRV